MVETVLTGLGASGAYISSYELMGQVQLVLDPMIFTNTPLDTPLMSGINSEGLPALGAEPLVTRTYWWQEEDIPTPRAQLNEALDNSETGIDVESGEGSKFAIGDGIRIDDEIMEVTAITNDTLTVTRGAMGTAAAVHSDGADIVGLGSILAEGEVAGGVGTDRYKNFNYSKIFTRSLAFTRTGQIIPKVGVSSEMAKQLFANQHSIRQQMEQSLLYGVRYNSDANEKRSYGGIFDMVVSHVDTTTTAFSVSAIESAQETLFISGFAGSDVWGHPVNFKTLNDLANTSILRVEFDDARRGRQRVQYVETEYGSVALHRNRHLRTKDGFMSPSPSSGAGMKRMIMTPLTLEKLGKIKDKDEWMMVAEEGFQIKGQRAFVKFTGLTGSVRTSVPTATEEVPAAHRHGAFQGPSGYEGDYPN